MPKNTFTVEDIWALPRVGSPEPSPDGSELIVPVQTYSMDTNEGTVRLWRLPAKGGKPQALTTAEASTGQPAWSPDGTQILFVRKPGGKPKKGGPKHPGKPQIYLMPADGGEPERLTDLPLGAMDPKWFPDGKRIAFIVQLYDKALTVEKTAKLDKKKKDEPVRAEVTEDRWYRFWDHTLTGGEVFHIFVMDLATRKLTDLTPKFKQRWAPMEPAGQYDIAPDGKEIAFSACRVKPPYHEHIVWGVYTVNVKTRTMKLLDRPYPGDAERPRYSPDGRCIVYGHQKMVDFYADRIRLVRYDRKKRTHTVLNENWDRSAAGWTFGNARTLYFAAEDLARVAVYSFDIGGKKPPRRLITGGSYGAPKVAGNRIYTTTQSLKQPPEVVSFGTNGKGLKRLTNFTRPVMKGKTLSDVQEMYFEGAEGHRVQMGVVWPPGVKRGAKKQKLVHMIHGGPHGVFGDIWQWRWCAQAFAAPGYLVALVNFHGSTSWGQEFAQCIRGRWGDQPYNDILAATDLLIDKGWVDSKKMAISGGSYGGYMVSWICSQTRRFACAINHAGVCDFQAQYASDVTHGRRASMGGEPWDDVAGLDRYNPMRHAHGFKTPMLVIHGEKDYRVPYGQGLEIYGVHKAMKLPAKLVCYPDENHWILKPRNSRLWYREVLGWLKRWLK